MLHTNIIIYALMTLFSTDVPEFTIVGIHTQPDHAITELDHLVDVYEDIQRRDRESVSYCERLFIL